MAGLGTQNISVLGAYHKRNIPKVGIVRMGRTLNTMLKTLRFVIKYRARMNQ